MFPYDVFALIENVENKPCLWDKSINDYKNTILTKNAWVEICKFFEPEFDMFEDKKKTVTIKLITKKWNNIRDTFKKSLATKSGQAPKKKYMYHAQLQFLLKVFQPQDTADNYQDNSDSTQDSSTQISLNETACCTPSTSTANSLPQRNKKRMNPVDVEILKAIQSCATNSIKQTETIQNDEDMAFLQSMLPSIKKITADDKLEFRIEMMQLLRKYTNKQRLRHVSSTDSLDSTVSPSMSPAWTSAATMTPRQHNVTHDLDISNDINLIQIPTSPTVVTPMQDNVTQDLGISDDINLIETNDEFAVHTNDLNHERSLNSQNSETVNSFSELFNQNFSE